MFCPNCGQQRISSETSFCSRCGFLLTAVTDLLATGGVLPTAQNTGGVKTHSERSRGLKQGLFIFLLTFLVVPLLAIVTVQLHMEPWAVTIAAITLFVGGLLRMAYALLFESSQPQGVNQDVSPAFLNRPQTAGALPPERSVPASVYAPPAGTWKDTNDLQPASVTEHTTRLLEKEEDQ